MNANDGCLLTSHIAPTTRTQLECADSRAIVVNWRVEVLKDKDKARARTLSKQEY